MTRDSKTIRKTNGRGEPVKKLYQQADRYSYGFVFSDNIEDWQRTRHNQKRQKQA